MSIEEIRKCMNVSIANDYSWVRLAVEDAKELLAKIEQLEVELEKHRWIPVSEEYPAEFKDYAVTDGKEWWQEYWGFVDHSGAKGWEHNCDGTITHWKPIILPEKLECEK